MIKGKTELGFEFKVDDQVTEDVDFLEALTTASKGEDDAVGALFEALKILLGEKQYADLKDHIRKEKGRVLLDDLSKEFEEIIKIASAENEDVKN